MPNRALVDALVRALGSDAVNTDPEVLKAHSRDRTPIIPVGTPVVLVRPRSAAGVAATIQLARDHSVPVVTRGAGSGLAGGANAIDGCILLSTSSLTDLAGVDTGNASVRAAAGVINSSVGEAAGRVGLRYPPDPASAEFSTIGGNVATNAGGLCCIRYGVTGDYVMSAEVVLGTGELVRVGTPTRKNVAGYDLVSLLTGSEGTLGVVTEATLRLVPDVAETTTVVGFFSSVDAAAGVVSDSGAIGFVPAAMELMDRVTIEAVESHVGIGVEAETEAMLLSLVEGRDRSEVDRLASVMEANGAEVLVSTDDFEARQLFEVRKLAFPALERRGAALLDDVAVPPSMIAELVRQVHRIAARHDVTIATFGHAGEGNLHPTIVFDEHDVGESARAMLAFTDLMAAAGDLGGSITGEHGVGLLKRQTLAESLSPALTEVQAGIKVAFDPDNILNPGKAIPPRGT